MENIAADIAAFLLSRRAAGRTLRTITWYQDQLGAFLAFALGQTELDTTTVERYLAEQAASRISQTTLHARYRALRAFFNWRRQRTGVPSPLDGIEPPKLPRKRIRHVTLGEYRKVYEATDGDDWLSARDRCIMMLLFFSGLRVSELVNLQLADVNAGTGLVLVRHGKGGNDRLVPVSPDLGPALLVYLLARPVWSGNELWLSSDGYGGVRGALTVEGVRQMLKRRCRQASVRYLNPHAWRHGFAMAFLNAGAQMSAISAMMGHSSERITEEIYAHWLTDGLKREYVDVYGRIQARTDD